MLYGSLTAAIAVALTATAAAPAAALIVDIDRFSDPFPDAAPAGTSLYVDAAPGQITDMTTQTGLLGVVGQQREASLNFFYAHVPGVALGEATLQIADGSLQYTRTGGGASFFVDLYYDAPSLAGFNLTNATKFVINVEAVTGEFFANVSLQSGATGASTGPVIDEPGRYTVSLADYPGINLASVDTIGLQFTHTSSASSGGSFAIESFQIELVPEPAALALLTVGGLFLVRRPG